MAFTIFYTTHASKADATKIGNHLLEKKWIACFNVFPISSGYWWQGTVENDDEWVALLKTTTALEKIVEEEVLNRHPYDTPCILRWEVSANSSYENWIAEEVDESILHQK